MATLKIAHRSVEVAYDDEGAGLPVVLLHAFPLDRQMWSEQAKNLAASGFRILRPDYPGFGGSSELQDQFTVDELADWTADFLDALKLTGPVVVGGLSMGGYVAMAFARRHPQRLHGLILADTKAPGDDEAGKAGRDQMLLTLKDQGPAGVINAMLGKLLAPESVSTQPTLADDVRAMGIRQSQDGIGKAIGALRDRPDALPELDRINVPTLVIVGAADVITPPEQATKIADKIPQARKVVIPEVGHLSNLEAPEAFTKAVLSFLHELPPIAMK